MLIVLLDMKKKNLLFLIKALSASTRQVKLTITGPVEDAIYWEECLQEIQKLPTWFGHRFPLTCS